MSFYDEARELFAEDESGYPTSQRIATIISAEPNLAAAVIAAKVGDDNGRSPWLWVRLQNGDFLLGCFPCGETYLSTEGDLRRP